MTWLGACDSASDHPFEVVVDDASLGGASPVVIGASTNIVSWSASPAAGMTMVGAASLSTLPGTGMQLATATGPVAHAGDFILVAASHRISRVGIDGALQPIVEADPDALGATTDAQLLVAWSMGPTVAWGMDADSMMADLRRVDRCDHIRVTPHEIYVAADSSTSRRLLRIDPRTGVDTAMTTSKTWAAMFPGGAVDTATYTGRIVHADDAGALWLVEELPSGRGVLVDAPVDGQPSVLLSHIAHASGFFASTDALYWQEGDEILTAPRTGGAASIVTSLPGPAGAFADGYLYFVDGASIERVRVE